MEIWLKGFPAFSYVVDTAGTPDVLFRKNLTASVAFSYRVHNTGDAVFRPHDGPAPGSPHPTGKPDCSQAPTIPEQLIQIESLLPGDPWLAPDATTTSGNNCNAYADLVPPQGQNAGDVSGQVTAPQVFDYTYDHSQPVRR
jgi:extracellular elastinolytic metalloproteinase